MGFSYEVMSEQHMALAVFDSAGTPTEVFELVRLLAHEVACGGDFHVVVDARKVEYRPSVEDTRAIVNSISTLDRSFRGRIGVVVSGAFMFGMARMTSIMGELNGLHMAAFQDYQEAYRWARDGQADQAKRQDQAGCMRTERLQ
jgi:hypothetical protein